MQIFRHPYVSTALCIMLLASAQQCLALNNMQDTDGDNIPDIEEDENGNGTMDSGETNPYNADTDNGGESDGSEKNSQRNPLDQVDDMTYDADGDGLANGIEVLKDTDPKKPDTDDDGLNDAADPFPLDSKFQIDANANGLPDEWEKGTGLDVFGTGVQTKVDDPDGDGLTNAEELARDTDPTNADTDHDGIDDKTEMLQGLDPQENACLAYATAEPFWDMQGHWSGPYVTTLRGVSILPDQTALVRGYEAQNDQGEITMTFAPDQPVTRYEFLKMVTLSACVKLKANVEDATEAFTDLPREAAKRERPDAAFRRSVIYTASSLGIVEGYADGTFLPDAPVSRAEAVKILSLAAHLTPIGATGSIALPFTDVTPNDWFQPYVSIATEREIVQGYGDSTFRPANSITRAEAAKIVELSMRQNPLINGYVLPEHE